MTFGHGGNIYEMARLLNCRPTDIVDMSSNINPLGPPPGLLEFLKENMGKIRISLKTPEANRKVAVKLRALMDDADANPVLRRMAG